MPDATNQPARSRDGSPLNSRWDRRTLFTDPPWERFCDGSVQLAYTDPDDYYGDTAMGNGSQQRRGGLLARLLGRGTGPDPARRRGGRRPATYRVYDGPRMLSGVVVGSGRHRDQVVERIGQAVADDGKTVLWRIEPARRPGGPMLVWETQQLVTFDSAPSGTAGALVAAGVLDLVDQLEALVEHRAAAVMNTGGSDGSDGPEGFAPSHAVPGVLLIIDDAQDVISVIGATRLHRLVTEGASAGVAVLLAMPSCELRAFDESEPLRQSVLAGGTCIVAGDADFTSVRLLEVRYGVDLARLETGYGHLLHVGEVVPFRIPPGASAPRQDNGADR